MRRAPACIAEGVAVERRAPSRMADRNCARTSVRPSVIRRNPVLGGRDLTLAWRSAQRHDQRSPNARALAAAGAAPREIVRVYSGQSQMSWPNYHDLRDRSTVVEDLAAHGSAIRALTIGTATSRAMGEIVSPNYLTMLGVPPLLGRTFTAADSRADVIVLSERTWRTRYASDPQIVGRHVAQLAPFR